MSLFTALALAEIDAGRNDFTPEQLEDLAANGVIRQTLAGTYRVTLLGHAWMADRRRPSRRLAL